MTIEATYPDGTYRYVANTFDMLRLVNKIHSFDEDCLLKEIDLLSGTIKADEYDDVIEALESFKLKDEQADDARDGLLDAIRYAKDNGYEWVIFT